MSECQNDLWGPFFPYNLSKLLTFYLIGLQLVLFIHQICRKVLKVLQLGEVQCEWQIGAEINPQPHERPKTGRF